MNNWFADLGNGNYRNPILYTDYSDPDAIRVGDDYYMTASSFCNTPGLPILHSKDLVNWKVVNYAIKNIPYERYAKPCHGCGVWAPAIRYHEGIYYIFFPMPDEGIFVTKTTDPFGEWSEPYAIFEGKGWIDPCPFWDEDGKAYMVSGFAKSRIGFKSILNIAPMEPDCSRLISEGQHVFDGNVNNQETIEGPKLYKRNGYYYIFAPAGGVKTGWQVVLRSKEIYGPYEYRNVMVQGNTDINGPHQGAWVDTQTGEDWFLHFQDVYAAGRIVHLQPMVWENDWPIIGKKISDVAGEPVMTYKKPDIGQTALDKAFSYRQDNNLESVYAPDFSDDFKNDKLGMQWQWNANHDDSFAECTPNGLRLYAKSFDEDMSISDLPNLLLQKWAVPEFEAKTTMDISNLSEGDMAGIVSMGMAYAALAVRINNGRRELITINGEQTFRNEVASSQDEFSYIKDIKEDIITMKYQVNYVGPDADNVPEWHILLSFMDGDEFKPVVEFRAVAGRWVGVKEGMFCMNYFNNNSNGYALMLNHKIV